MNNNYKPFVFQLPPGSSSLLKKDSNDNDLILSSVISYPLFSLGFHSFLHRTKNAMEILTNKKSNKTGKANIT